MQILELLLNCLKIAKYAKDWTVRKQFKQIVELNNRVLSSNISLKTNQTHILKVNNRVSEKESRVEEQVANNEASNEQILEIDNS